MINGVIEKPIMGMESVMLCREVVSTDEVIIDQANKLDEVLVAKKQELEQKDINLQITEMMNMPLEHFELFAEFNEATGALLGTKKMVTVLGLRLPNEISAAGLFTANKSLQSVMPEVMRRMLSQFHDALNTGTLNDMYELFFQAIRDDLKELPSWKYDVVGSQFDSLESYEDALDKEVEYICTRLYESKYSMGILLTHNGIQEAKEELKAIFNEYGMNMDNIINILIPEQLVSEVTQFHQIISMVIQQNPEFTAIATEKQNEMLPKINAVLTKLADQNAFSKFNQTNNMQANIFPTLIIFELIASILVRISAKLFTINSLDELTIEERAVVDMVDVVVAEKMASYEVEYGIGVDNAHIALLSAISHGVSGIVADQRALRSVDGRFQQLASSVAMSVSEMISELVNQLRLEHEAAEASQEPAIEA